MGGRAAEEVVLNKMTNGAANDIERATEIARKMVCEFGMSDLMGPLSFGKREEHIFLGREIAQHKDYSEQTAMDIDREIRNIVTSSYERAKSILTENIQALHALAQALLERETIDGSEIDKIIDVASRAEEVGKPSEGADQPAQAASPTVSPAEAGSQDQSWAEEGQEIAPPHPADPSEAPA
jgi:cell division protease FtsH